MNPPDANPLEKMIAILHDEFHRSPEFAAVRKYQEGNKIEGKPYDSAFDAAATFIVCARNQASIDAQSRADTLLAVMSNRQIGSIGYELGTFLISPNSSLLRTNVPNELETLARAIESEVTSTEYAAAHAKNISANAVNAAAALLASSSAKPGLRGRAEVLTAVLSSQAIMNTGTQLSEYFREQTPDTLVESPFDRVAKATLELAA